jgi:hypothetical protein
MLSPADISVLHWLCLLETLIPLDGWIRVFSFSRRRMAVGAIDAFQTEQG